MKQPINNDQNIDDEKNNNYNNNSKINNTYEEIKDEINLLEPLKESEFILASSLTDSLDESPSIQKYRECMTQKKN